MNINFFLLFLIATIALSCQKDDVEEPEVQSGGQPNSAANLGDTIELGNTANMTLFLSDTMKLCDNVGTPFSANYEEEFDLDQDGFNDVQLHFNNSPGGAGSSGIYSRSQLLSLNSAFSIHGFLRSDTSFFHVDTITSNQLQYITSCERLAAADTIKSISPNQPKIIYSGASGLFNVTNDTYSGSFDLYYRSSVSSQPSSGPSPYIYYGNYRDCFQIPLGSPVFMGIKMNDGLPDEKLGWIHMKQFGNNCIHVYQIAMQQ